MKNIFIIGSPRCGTTSLTSFFKSNGFTIIQFPLFSNPERLNKFEIKEIIKSLSSNKNNVICNPSCMSEPGYIKNLFNFINDNRIEDYIIIVLLRNSVDAFKSLVNYRLRTTTKLVNKGTLKKIESSCSKHYLYYENIKYLHDTFPDNNLKIIFSEDLFDKEKSKKILLEFVKLCPSINNLNFEHKNQVANKSQIKFKVLFSTIKGLLKLSGLYYFLRWLIPISMRYTIRSLFYSLTLKEKSTKTIKVTNTYLQILNDDFKKTLLFLKRKNLTNKIIIDLDNTISFSINNDYDNALVNESVKKKINDLKSNFRIIIFTSRNMNTFNSDIQLIKQKTYPKIISWLNKNDIFYDELIIGKPWCGVDGFYVDDRAIRPNEFEKMSLNKIKETLK